MSVEPAPPSRTTDAPDVAFDGFPYAMLPEHVLYADVSDRAVRLFAALARHGLAGPDSCYPSRDRLAVLLRCSVDSVDRALRELVTLGAVSTYPRRRPNGSQTSNGYLLHMGGRTPAAPPAAPVRPPERKPLKEETGADAPAALPGLPEPDPAPAPRRTVGQRARALAEDYRRALPPPGLANVAAVAGCVREALDAGVSEDEVAAALARLAEDDRSVTLGALQTAVRRVREDAGQPRRQEWEIYA